MNGPVPLLTCLLALALTACQWPEGAQQPVLNASNATPLELTLSVNGTPVGRLGPGVERVTLDVAIPTLPWTVETRAASGRVLATLDVPIDYVDGSYARSDLSCGSVMVWIGPEPIFGPAPPMKGAGLRGADCQP